MIPIENYDEFTSLFEQAVSHQLGDNAPIPIIETDGELDDSLLTPVLIEEINALEPYGREWPKPMFFGEFTIVQLREVGQNKTHLSCKLKTKNGSIFQAIYFNAKQSSKEPTPFIIGDNVCCTYQPGLNNFAGRTTLQLRINSMQ